MEKVLFSSIKNKFHNVPFTVQQSNFSDTEDIFGGHDESLLRRWFSWLSLFKCAPIKNET